MADFNAVTVKQHDENEEYAGKYKFDKPNHKEYVLVNFLIEKIFMP